MSDETVSLQWDRIEDLSGCKFEERLRNEIESNLRWFRSCSGEYADGVRASDFGAALKSLERISRTEFSRFQIEAIEEELSTVMWFLEVMSHSEDDPAISKKYFLYVKVWNCIAKAGVKLSQGKGTTDHRLSHAQKVFREICRQAGILFTSDQALASALKRALRDAGQRGQK